jgi:hypothetical protein
LSPFLTSQLFLPDVDEQAPQMFLISGILNSMAPGCSSLQNFKKSEAPSCFPPPKCLRARPPVVPQSKIKKKTRPQAVPHLLNVKEKGPQLFINSQMLKS